MATYEPTDEQLHAALTSIKRTNPDFGVKRLLDELKARHPEWKVLKKRVKDVHTPINASSARDPGQRGAAGSQAVPSSDTRAVIEQQIAAFDALARSGQRVPISRFHTRAKPTLSLSLLRTLDDSKFTVGLTAFEYYLKGKDDSKLQDLLYAPFRLFRAEWRAYLGPKDKPLPRATPHQDNIEAVHFMMLFPYGTGHYANQPDLSFEEYVLHKLSLRDAAFRTSKDWLLWVLTRTQNEELTIAVNCVLAVKHGIKARHLGQRNVEAKAVEDEFVAPLVADV